MSSPVKLWFDVRFGFVVESSVSLFFKNPSISLECLCRLKKPLRWYSRQLLSIALQADIVVSGLEIDYTNGAHYQGTITNLRYMKRVATASSCIFHRASHTLTAPVSRSLVTPSPPPAPGHGHRCFRRAKLDRTKCVNSSHEDTWTRLNGNWIKWDGTNCFSGSGAVNLLPEPYSNSLSLEGCKEACNAGLPACEGIVVDAPSRPMGARQRSPSEAAVATVVTDLGFLNPDVYCERYCTAPWSEASSAPVLRSHASQFRSKDKANGPTTKLGAREQLPAPVKISIPIDACVQVPFRSACRPLRSSATRS